MTDSRSVRSRAYRYAMKCCPKLYRDLVHDAYIRNFNKDGTNLFDKEIYTVLRYIRNVWLNEIRDGKYISKGELRTRFFIDVEELNLASGLAPDRQLISKEFYEHLFSKVDTYSSGHWLGPTTNSIDPKILRQFLELLDAGFSIPEICKIMNMSPQRLYYYKNKIRSIIKTMEYN